MPSPGVLRLPTGLSYISHHANPIQTLGGLASDCVEWNVIWILI